MDSGEGTEPEDCTVSVVLSKSEYEKVRFWASTMHKEVPELIRDVAVGWLAEQQKTNEAEAQIIRERFIRQRYKGLDFPEIASRLGRSEQELHAWDEEIRTDSDTWTRAFMFLLKKMDPLQWEMKGMDRFYELWGKRERREPS